MVVVKLVQSLAKMLLHPPDAFREEVLQHIRKTGTSLSTRLRNWIELSEAFNTRSEGKREDLETLTEFPLLPASQGFCLSLRKALSVFERNLSME